MTTQAATRSPGSALRLAIGVATVGRADVLLETLATFRSQTRPADAIFVCAPSEADILGVAASEPDVTALAGPRGLPRQRNVILQAAAGFDVLVFFDDDFMPAAGYFAAIEALFSSRPDVSMATGEVIRDGILGLGLEAEEARAVLAAETTTAPETIADVYNCYGCNMAVRIAAAASVDAAFDENLPLYAWLEDVDFSRQLAKTGRIVRTTAARGVHLGVKSGRQSGLRLGYSQVANPVYLMLKGTCGLRKGVPQIARNLLANFGRSLAPEAHVDRRGRAIGNLRALLDLAKGRVTPSRILEL